jgi:hypothetical protein
MSLTAAETERLREAGLRDGVIAQVQAEAATMALLVLAGGMGFMLITASLIEAEIDLRWGTLVLAAGAMARAMGRLLWLRAHPDRAGARRLIGLAVRGRSAPLELLAWEISRKADPREALALISGAPRPLSDAELDQERASHVMHLKAFGLTAALLAGVGALLALVSLIGRT